MTSWRESTPQQTQDDFDGLLNAVLPFAEQSLSRSGEFYPYGAVVTTEGEGRLTSAHAGDDRPNSTDVLEVLYDGARADAGNLRAVAFVANVRADGSDAIRVELEAPHGASIQVVLPYKRHVISRKLTMGAMTVTAGTRHVWEN